jgi:hypothetical protein
MNYRVNIGSPQAPPIITRELQYLNSSDRTVQSLEQGLYPACGKTIVYLLTVACLFRLPENLSPHGSEP